MNIEENMVLTDKEAVMSMVEEGRKRALERRDERLGIRKVVARVGGYHTNAASSISLYRRSGRPHLHLFGNEVRRREDSDQEKFEDQYDGMLPPGKQP
ncbi:MAG: hypothetical protein ACLTBV_14005 [Enterocloster bolteae]